MAVILSKGCAYGIQASLYIALHEPRRIGIREMATNLTIPQHFLAKVLQQLAIGGVLISHKGALGGYSLAQPKPEIRLLDIVEAIDGRKALEECVLGFVECNRENPCVVHDKWGRLRDKFEAMLAEETLEILVEAVHAGKNISMAYGPEELQRQA
ncbi:MAG: transcriptional regulator [Ectothiorhodospiraceae bacterium]|nr:transcriptional regulator [Ectothiorhodospiraceae bacterium]